MQDMQSSLEREPGEIGVQSPSTIIFVYYRRDEPLG